MGGTSCNDLARTQTLSADWGAITCQSHIQGQLGTVTDPSEGVTGYHYDPAGNCDRADYPNGDVITRVYDIVGHDDLAGDAELPARRGLPPDEGHETRRLQHGVLVRQGG